MVGNKGLMENFKSGNTVTSAVSAMAVRDYHILMNKLKLGLTDKGCK